MFDQGPYDGIEPDTPREKIIAHVADRYFGACLILILVIGMVLLGVATTSRRHHREVEEITRQLRDAERSASFWKAEALATDDAWSRDQRAYSEGYKRVAAENALLRSLLRPECECATFE